MSIIDLAATADLAAPVNRVAVATTITQLFNSIEQEAARNDAVPSWDTIALSTIHNMVSDQNYTSVTITNHRRVRLTASIQAVTR